MTSNFRGRKFVQIQTGHKTRFIEKRNPHRPGNKNFKSQAMRKISQKDRIRKIVWNKTYRPTVSELVYRYLEKASNREVTSMQKNNATNQFRKFHRRKYTKRLDPCPSIKSRSKRIKGDALRTVSWKPHMFSYSKIRSKEGNSNMAKCILEVLSFGTILGLLEPADEKGGVVFRISSDLNISSKN